MAAADGFVDQLIGSPLGVSLLAVLEAGPSGGEGWLATSPISDAAAVAAATDRVREMSFGALARAAVWAGVHESGPWTTTAPERVAAAYRQAERRVPIAEAVADGLGAQLHAPLDRSAQQWWTDGAPGIESLAPLFHDFDHVYGAGEFTWAGLRTATDPPPEALTEMVGAWEIETGPVTRWWLPVRPDARVYEIHGPGDWVRLVCAHPRPADPHPGWELPGINQHLGATHPLLRVSGQRAARTSVRQHLVPDWRSVADDYDAVHLSWAGFITSEGCVVDLGDGDVTMLRYWASERTLWLADVFDEPRAAPDPQMNFSGRHWPHLPPRTTTDRRLVHRLLGRAGAS